MAKVNSFAIVKKETGEIVEDIVLFIGKNPLYKDSGYVKVFVSFLQDIVLDEEVTGKAIRLLLYIVERMDYNTLTVYIDRDEVLRDLNIATKTFYNWRNTLIKKGYIKKITHYKYELIPYSFIKGSSEKVRENDIKKEAHKRIEENMEKIQCNGNA